MTYNSVMNQRLRVHSIVAFMVLAPAMFSPVCAQVEQQEPKQRSIVQKLETMDRQDVLAVMRSAIKYAVKGQMDQDDKSLEEYIAKSVKIAPQGIISKDLSVSKKFADQMKSVPAEVRALAERVATALGADIDSFPAAVYCTAQEGSSMADCQFENEDTEVFVATTIPEIRGSEARISVRMWFASGAIYSQFADLKLERGTGGQWQVINRISWKHNSIYILENFITKDDSD